MKITLQFIILVILVATTGVNMSAYAGNQLPESIELPAAKLESEVSVEEAMSKRRSIRSYLEEPISLEQISQLLWAAQGITEPATGYRTAPSAGALYPLEAYILAGNITGLPAGLYRYIPETHKLILITEGDKRNDLFEASLYQSSIKDAAGVLIFCAIYERITGRYGERGIRYAHIEAGHISQNVYLQAVPLGLGTVVIGAFNDNEVKRILGLPEPEAPLYLMPVGVIQK